MFSIVGPHQPFGCLKHNLLINLSMYVCMYVVEIQIKMK